MVFHLSFLLNFFFKVLRKVPVRRLKTYGSHWSSSLPSVTGELYRNREFDGEKLLCKSVFEQNGPLISVESIRFYLALILKNGIGVMEEYFYSPERRCSATASTILKETANEIRSILHPPVKY